MNQPRTVFKCGVFLCLFSRIHLSLKCYYIFNFSFIIVIMGLTRNLELTLSLSPAMKLKGSSNNGYYTPMRF